MLTLEAKRMGFRVITLDPVVDSPCGQVADEQIIAEYDDPQAVADLGARSDVVTYEFENIPLASVQALEEEGRIVRPASRVLAVTQDRLAEKRFVRGCGVMTVEFAGVACAEELEAAFTRIGFPGVLKTVRGGYDGKGQWFVRDVDEARKALSQGSGVPLIYEQFLHFDREVSVVATRGADGASIAFPVSENLHDRGVLATSIIPARVSPLIIERVRAAARVIGERLGVVGTYCIEFFVRGEEIFVNEIAPRVHNSGHFSLDATQISQFEAHIRAICDLPLVEPELLRPSVMVNILGTGEGDHLDGIPRLLTDPGLKLHLYGKTHAAVRRKMGHFTVLAPTLDEALVRAEVGRKILHWTAAT
jgi:5-(carboxyamino)imidazole ribonucleotide synthase